MKKLPFGIVLILFGILVELAGLNDIWIPIIGGNNCDVVGLAFGIAGLIFAIAGCFEKKQ